MGKNIKLKEGFSQVCVWPGTEIEDNERGHLEFELGLGAAFDVKIQFIEKIITNPDTDKNGNIVPETGGRPDIFFAVHKDDIEKFSVCRLKAGIRWIEDVLAKCNYKCHIYPNHVYNYVTWNKENIDFPKGDNSAI